MATVEELRANFTATFGGMTAGIRTIRQALQGIGQSSEEASQKSNRAFKSLGSTLDNLQAELKKTGKQNEFKDLNTSIEKAQKELKETGQVSEQSMKQLQTAVQQSKTKLGTLGDDGKKNMQQFAPILEKVDKQLQQLGVKNGLDQLTEDQKKAELQTKKLSEVVDDQTKKLEDENNRYKDLSAGILGAGSKSQQLREKSEHLTNVMKIQAETVDVLKRKYNDSVSAVGKNADETKRLESALNHASSSMKNTEDDLKRTNANIATQSTLWGRMNSKLGDAKKRFQDIEDSGSTVTRTFGIATAVVGGGLGLATKSAADFQSKMSGVKSVMDPESARKYGKSLEDLAIIQGAKTAFSATQAAEAEGELVKAGVSVRDIIHGGLSGALNLATAGELDLKDAAEIASTALNSFRKDNLSVAQAANILSGAANASATDVGEMKYALSAVSAVAAGVGLTFKDTSTALAVMAQNGLKGSDAGTSLKTMLSNLSPHTTAAANMFDKLKLFTFDASKAMEVLSAHGIKPLSKDQGDLMDQLTKLSIKMSGAKEGSKAQQKAFEELTKGSGAVHSAFYKQNGQIKDMADISELLRTHLKDLNGEQRQQALYTMFGSDAIRGATILFNEGAKGVDNMAASMSKIKAADVAKQKLDNLKGTFEQLKGSVETASISLGEAMLPAFKWLAERVQALVDWFNKLPDPMKRFIAIGAGIVASVLAMVTAFGFIAMGVGSAIKGVQSFILLMLKFREQASLSSKSAATLGASASTAGAAMDTAGAGVGRASGKIKGLHGILGLAGGALMIFGGKWGMVSGIIMNFLPEIIKVGKNILSFGRVATVAGVGAEGLAGGTGAAATALGILTGPVGWVILGIAALAVGFLAAYKYIKPFHYGVNKVASALKNGFISAVNGVKSAFQPALKATHDWGKSVSSTTQNAINSYEKLNNKASEQLQLLDYTGKKVSKSTRDALVNTYSEMASKISSTLKTHYDKDRSTLKSFFKDAKGISDSEQSQMLLQMKLKYEKQQDIVSKGQKRITNILDDARKDHRKLTQKEKDEINGIQNQMEMVAVENMSKGAKEQRSIFVRLQQDSSKISAKQAADIVKQSKKAEKSSIDSANRKYDKVIQAIIHERDDTHSISADQAKKLMDAAKKQRDDAISKAKSMNKNVVKEAKKQAHGHADWIDWETGKVLSPWDRMLNSIGNGFNWLTSLFTGKKSKSNKVKAPQYSAKGGAIAYAKGTDGHPGGPAILGDGTGDNAGAEAVITPKGTVGFSPSHPTIITDLPKGSTVIPAKLTRALFGKVPKYANGIGDAFNWLLQGAKSLVSNTFSKFGVSLDLPGSFKKIGSDALSKVKNMATDWVKSKTNDWLGDITNFGSSVKGWTNVIKAAAKMSGVTLTASSLSTILKRINKESGGNQTIMQKIVDVNSKAGHPAQGLLQFIPSTFATWARKGHTNILSGLDQLLALFNNSNWLRDISAPGGWGPTGHRRFEHGGWNFMHTMAELSEGNKAEVILPVENKNRTLDLMAQVLSTYGPGKLTGEANTSSDQTTKYQLSVLELLQKIVDSNGKDVFIDGQKITDYIAQQLSFNARRKKAF